MEFGLGLVLSFTDNATAGINNAVNSLNQLTSIAEDASNSLNQMASLSALSVVADQLGSAFLGAGKTIISTLGQVISSVNETGQTLMYAENQLNALYANSSKTGKDVLGEIQQYAKQSMFDFEQLVPAVISLKSVGIEAFDSITSSTGNAKYSLLDYASALASFAPQMKNAYGTGVNAAIGAMREYIAEGNALSLKRGAGLDITGILGEDKGATIEERTRQVADLVEQLGMLGMVDMMANSPQVKLSNMGDVLFQLKGMISDSGVREAINGIIDVFYNFVSSISDERLQNIAKNIGSALTSLITPVEWLAKKIVVLAEGLVKLVENNPMLVKFATVGTALAGVLLVLAGVVLKFTSAMSGVSLMILAFGKSFQSIGGLVKVGASKMLSTLLPLTATIALLALAWKSDFAGIRTNVTNFVTGVTSSFNTARQAVNGSVSDLTSTLTALQNKGDFFSNLTIGIMKVMTLFRALSEAWNDNTLSEDTFLKAKELGILPLIEAILDLKYRFGLFKDGFIQGWKDVSDGIKNALNGMLDSVKGTALESLVDGVSKLLQKLADNDAQAWYDFGESFGKFTASALALWGAFKVLGGAVSIITKVVGVFKKLWGVITTVGGAISSTLSIIGTVVTAVLGFFGVVVSAPAWVVGAITTALVAIVALIIKYRDEIWAVLKTIGSWIYENVIKPVADFFVNLWNGIVTGVTTAFNAVKSFLSTVASWIYNNVIQPVVNFFMTYIYPFIEKIAEIVAKIIEIVVTLVSVFVQWVNNSVVQPIIQFFQNLWNGITTIFQNVATWFTEKFQLAVNGIKTAFSVVANWFSGVWNSIKSIFNNVATWFGDKFRSAVEKIKSFFSPLAEWFRGVWSKITSVFSNIGTKIADAISGAVKGAINRVLSGAGRIINGFISALNFAIGVINAIPGVKISKVSKLSIPQLAQGGVVDKPTMAVIGEAGSEAVMPLENNTGWIGKLASMIATQMDYFRPTNSTHMNTTNQGDTNQRYMTNNSTSNTTYEGDTDNSVVFNEGAIQLNVQNASEEEAIRLAKKIMEYIKRQKELDRMTAYA